MWIDTRDRNPSEDGFYIIQWTADGAVGGMNYTTEYGWNTSRHKDGTIHSVSVIDDVCIARWYDLPRPEPVPEEWHKEWAESLITREWKREERI